MCTVTVLMSVYNGEKYLREAIDSILAQSYRDFEFVIYDDCSTDGSSSIIQSYSDPRIIYRRNSVNQGLTRNLADGLLRSKSRYIVRMDADDIAYPHRLQTQVMWMDEHPEISIAGSSVSYFCSKPGDGGISAQPQDDTTIKATLFISFTLMHPSIIIRREDLIKHQLNYNPDYRYSQDHALYLDCIRYGLKFANISEPLLHMRSHVESISKEKHAVQQECSMRARFKFLMETGIAGNCSTEEIDVYNHLASGVYPDTSDKIRAYERFVNKIYNSTTTAKYFDKDLLREKMAQTLCDGAYYAVENKNLKLSSLAARKSRLLRYTSEWSLKKKVKFYLKFILP